MSCVVRDAGSAGLLSLPSDLQLGVALNLPCQLDRMALSGTCTLLRHHSVSAEWAECWAILTLDLEALISDAFYDQDGTKQHAFR